MEAFLKEPEFFGAEPAVLVLRRPQNVFDVMGGTASGRKTNGRTDTDKPVHAAIGLVYGCCGWLRNVG
jgi:hypothetical protein